MLLGRVFKAEHTGWWRTHVWKTGGVKNLDLKISLICLCHYHVDMTFPNELSLCSF